MYSPCSIAHISISLVLIPVLMSICVTNYQTQLCGNGCDAILKGQQGQRFLINFGADLAEIFSNYPTSNLARILFPIIKRAQNHLTTNRAFGRQGRQLLSKDPGRVEFWVYNDKWNPESFFNVDPSSPTFRRFRVNRHNQELCGSIFIHNSKNILTPIVAYLAATDHTVIAVDWSALAQPTTNLSSLTAVLLPAVSDNVFRVGNRVADLIVFLLKNGIVSNLQQIHVIGHSLGAHVAGFAGDSTQKKLGQRFGRITGLDPAGPLFRSTSENLKLDKSDADFVDIIHTSVGGLYGQLGHADFYPNGGIIQPHCFRSSLTIECNHLSAYDYFMKSILQRNIFACRCNTWQEYRRFCRYSCPNRSIMGEYASPRTRGKYFLDLYPYGLD